MFFPLRRDLGQVGSLFESLRLNGFPTAILSQEEAPRRQTTKMNEHDYLRLRGRALQRPESTSGFEVFTPVWFYLHDPKKWCDPICFFEAR